jgi:transposase
MAGGGLLALSQRDRDRLKELHGVIRGQLGTSEAAQRLGLTARQVRRVVKRIREEGDRGVIHRLRGRRSNRRLSEKVRVQAVGMLTRTEYRDFGPTLAAEHLGRRGLEVSRETVRKWMLESGLWRRKPQRIEAVHVWRQRRACFGELVLMDTSEHEWLEGRGPRLYLIAMIDDATSRLEARFVEHDSSEENLRTLKRWLLKHGRPLALYTDKNTIFQTPRKAELVEKLGAPEPTNFAAALEELGIEWIAAHSPQAKGRVERLFETLQDRLLKELRIAKVCSLDEANRFLDRFFLPLWQERFTVEPSRKQDAHRSLNRLDLDSILCRRDWRQLAADYTVRLHGQAFAIPRNEVLPGLRKAKVLIERRLDGSLWVRFRNKHISLRPAPAATPSGLRPPVLAAKPKLPPKPWHPPSQHPWRQSIRLHMLKRTFLPGAKADISTLR